MTPPFIFRIDEFTERKDAPDSIDLEGNWVPIAVEGWNVRRDSRNGVTERWWSCDGQQIKRLSSGPPDDAVPHATFSTFYSGGHGFWIMNGDGTTPQAGETWHRLLFNHHEETYASELTNAGTERTLRCQQAGSRWPHMLLPDIYHGPVTPYQNYGGLTGDLPIFLSLIAFSMKPSKLKTMLPYMMSKGNWTTHLEEHGRTDKRGVIVYVYTSPGHSQELKRYENGDYGKYYY